MLPVRDEAARVGACVRALSAQRGIGRLEILVLDDGSGDGTAEIVRLLAAADPRVRLLSGAALPAGWLGKPHACAQLATAAAGGYWCSSMPTSSSPRRRSPRWRRCTAPGWACCYLAAVLGRAAAARRTGSRSWPDVIAHPASTAVAAALILDSVRARRRGTLSWKGRPIGKHDLRG